AYSSLFLATPLLADLKEREPRFQALQGRVQQRRSGGPTTTVRLSQRSAHAPDVPEAEAESEEAAPATAVRRPSSPPRKSSKGGRPGKPKNKKRKR
ncbi:MAG: protein translocase subunit SecF, partial [Actinomycetota bacterium]|nr:protein translocase subunit SecF [Actinomycetota bacterium]